MLTNEDNIYGSLLIMSIFIMTMIVISITEELEKISKKSVLPLTNKDICVSSGVNKSPLSGTSINRRPSSFNEIL
jgi:hypothetical protein